VNSEYFLTRQTANLLEDFVREISLASSLFLLYGDTGVGKTRLLNQLATKRLADYNCHNIDFAQNNQSDMANVFEQVARDAKPGDVIMVDHFEAASNRAQDQIFKSWLTDGRDKKLNIIIAAISTSFNAFRQLAQQYQVEARSFQLMPCSTAEVESYLHFRLYPDEALGELNIPSALRTQIRSSNGVIASLNKIIERDGDSISLGITQERRSRSPVFLVIGLLTIILAVAGYFYFQQIKPEPSPGKASDAELAKVDEAESPSEEKQLTNGVEIAVELTSTQNLEEGGSVENTDAVKMSEVEGNQTQESHTETGEQITTNPIDTTEENSNTESVATTLDAEVMEQPRGDWFQNKLRNTLDWIRQGDQQRATIQLMSIGFDSFNESAFQAYLNKLTTAGIDINQVRVFKTRAAGQEIYSIIYGEFDNRQEANQQIQSLPEALGADSPIPRSAGSIAREIERAENQ